VDASQCSARRTGALRRRLRRDLQDEAAVRGGRATHPGDPGAPRSRAAPREDAASGPVRRQGGLRLPRLPPAQAHERRDLGTRTATFVLPASLAERALDEAATAEGERVDAEMAMPRGPPRG